MLASRVNFTDHANETMYVTGAGEDVTLNVLADVSPENYMAYSREFYGTQVIIHRHDDFAGQTTTRIIAQVGFETIIIVNPNVVVSADDVRDMHLAQRGCVFDEEVLMTL